MNAIFWTIGSYWLSSSVTPSPVSEERKQYPWNPTVEEIDIDVTPRHTSTVPFFLAEHVWERANPDYWECCTTIFTIRYPQFLYILRTRVASEERDES